METSSAPVAHVVIADELPLASDAPLPIAARRLGRAMAANEIEPAGRLDALAKTPKRAGLGWLTLAPRHVAVVPRLAALGRPDLVRAEVTGVAGPSLRGWVHAPR